MEKVTTGCCALCQIHKISNETSIVEIAHEIEKLRKEMLANTEVYITTGNGQTAVFVIVSPGEFILEKNLIKLGFENKHIFPRRVGYPPVGDLKMYIKNL